MSRRSIVASVLLLALLGTSVWYAWPVTERQTIGVEGGRVIEIPGEQWFAAPFTPGDALSVRIDSTTPTRDGFRYDVRFIPYGPGEYVLTDWLRAGDLSHGQQPPPQNIPATKIHVETILPADFSGELFATPPSFIELRSGYRAWMALAWMTWIALLVPLALYGRRRQIDVLPASRAPSWSEQLAALLNRAAQRPLRAAEQADLEHLLWAWWSQRLALPDERLGETLQQLRQHPVAGRQLSQLESAFHAPGGLLDREEAQRLLHELAHESEAS